RIRGRPETGQRRRSRARRHPQHAPQRLLSPRVPQLRGDRAEAPRHLPSRPEPRGQAGGTRRPHRRLHARDPRRDGLHLRPAGGAAAGHLRVPAEDRLRARRSGGGVLRLARAPLADGARVMRRALLLAAASALALSACAYFNALYNARRHFADAERAAARGDHGTAYANYGTAIEKAARSLRRDPEGRWADDALYLIGLAHFARGDYLEAAAALERLVRETDDADILTGAYAYLGAAAVRLGAPAAALPRLDSAVARAGNRRDVAALARPGRARARFAVADEAAAWADVEAAAAIGGAMGREARLEWAARAVQLDQPDRAAAAFAALFRDKDAHVAADSVEALAVRAGQRWGGARTGALLDAVTGSAWPPAARDALRLRRAELLAAAGDSAEALREARTLADRAAGATADRARVVLARWALAA